MALDYELIKELEQVFDGRYMTRNECDRTTDSTYRRINDIKIDTAKIGTKLNIIVAILGAIGVAILSVVIKQLFGG